MECSPSTSDGQEITIVNERSKIIGVLTNEGIVDRTFLDIGTNSIEGSNTHSETNNGNFMGNEHHESPLNDFFIPPPEIPESSNETSDDENFYEIEEIDEIQTEEVQVEIPLKNYSNDVEHEDDYELGWEWLETDPGASFGPFTAQPGLMIETTDRTPEGFFNLLFDDSMWTLITQQMNIYAK